MNTIDFKSKLRAYSLATGAAITGIASAQANIVYTNVDPDSTLSGNGSIYQLDLNNDNVIDFHISINSFSQYYFVTQRLHVNSMGANSVAGVTSVYTNTYGFNSIRVASMLKSAIKIDQNASWLYGYSPVNLAMKYSGFTSFTAGKWWGATNKYLGLAINVSGQKYYGWARLSVDSSGKSFTIKDYAYNTKPGLMILSGDTGLITDVPSPSIEDDDITVYGFNNRIYLQVPDIASSKNHVSVYDMEGREVYSEMIQSSSKSFTIPGAAPGVYVVKVELGDAVVTKKILIQDN